ncbi:HSP20-like chaperone [Clathrospora elynae]|uniref:HSP20-like chaperone n=1 Tax=Clathrospora elynae TaxID=706981 RepID=A0A6A5SLD2_9PLEO|nr:HSP20-like chaperone [Clathrospora elynae]
MAFVITPRLAPVYQTPQCNPFGSCAPALRPTYGYHVSRPQYQPRRPQNSFFSQVNELLSEIDREAQRQAQLEALREAQLEALREAQLEAQRLANLDTHLEAQREARRQLQRKRALRAEFDVSQNNQGWQVDGDMQGFEQDNISIDVIDEHTLKISGNTQWHSDKAQAEAKTSLAIEQPTAKPEAETATTTRVATSDSDTASHKSYQPTVEDDFEDLGADTSSLTSASSGTSTSAESAESKGKGKAVEEPTATETAVASQPQPEVPDQQQQEQPQGEERVHGSFERSFRFPERIDTANVSASFKGGALKITVPRAQVPRTRRIAIL